MKKKKQYESHVKWNQVTALLGLGILIAWLLIPGNSQHWSSIGKVLMIILGWVLIFKGIED